MGWKHLATLVLFLGAIAQGALADRPDRVRVRGIRTFGVGCPTGTARAEITEDGSSFSLLMDDYIAQAAFPRAMVRRNCDIQVDIEVPSGWSYALVSADYRGFVDVPQGAMAIHRVMYAFDDGRRMPPAFQNGEGFAFQNTIFEGPKTQDYFIRNNLSITTAPRSRCSRGDVQTLYMNTLLTARLMSNRDRNATVTIGLDTLDGQVSSQNFAIEWFRCNSDLNDRRPQLPPRQFPPRLR